MKGAKLDGKRYLDFIAALEANDIAVMQKTATDGSFARLGYVGLFRYTEFQRHEDGSISLKIVERLPIQPAK